MVRRQLGVELRRLREQTGRTSSEIAKLLNWSDSKLSRIETARIGLSDGDLDRLCKIYQVDTGTRDRLRSLTRQSRQRGWWESYGDVLLDQTGAYIGYESEATIIRGYYTMLMPGLLQTDEYAMAVAVAESTSEDHDVRTQSVAVKMARQAILSREPPLQLGVILDEAVVRRQVGGADVMRRQLRRLLAQVQRDNISVQVLPFATGAQPGQAGGSFVLVELPPSLGGRLVFCEGVTSGVIRSKPEEFRTYDAIFHTLSKTALSNDETVEFLEAVTAA